MAVEVEAVGLAASLIREVSRNGFDKVYVIDRLLWTKVFDTNPRSYGELRYSGEGFEVTISKLGFPWGFFRAKVFDCYIEGLLRFRQKRVLFKPLRMEGGCKEFEDKVRSLGAPMGGVEVVEPEEVGW